MEIFSSIGKFIAGQDFEYSPNLGADDLERHLGIRFADKPKEVQFTEKNESVLFNKFLRPPYGRTTLELFSYLTTQEGGLYVPNLNIYFTSNPSRFTSHHESMHGYIVQVAPELEKQGVTMVFSGLYKLLVNGKVSADLEKASIWKTFVEGIAQWGAIETGINMTDKIGMEALSKRNNMIAGTEFSGYIVEKDQQFIDQQRLLLQTSLQLPAGHRFKKLRHLADWSKKDNLAPYRIGYIFADTCMAQLRNSGLETPRALELLITHPPTTMEQLFDPTVRYISALSQ